jgi:predicted RND superfamily exporter protein
LDKPEYGRIGRTFISQDRRRARFILRMEEADRTRPRATVMAEIGGIVRAQGFRTMAVAGLYPLQGELSTLVRGSVVRGLGGLLAALAVIVLIVTRSVRTALAMTVCLAVTPLALFGIVGLARMPLDIIAAPAANVALPLGIDEMIHLGHRVRQARRGVGDLWTAWNKALADMWQPILASMAIVASGFALFLLSDFPPTRRLGVLVCIGAVMTDLVVLLMLPALATFGRRRNAADREESKRTDREPAADRSGHERQRLWRHQSANRSESVDMVGYGLDDDQHGHGEDRSPATPNPGPQQQAEEDGQRAHALRFPH